MPTADTKRDVSSILVEGTGTPYIAIFDGSSNPIIDPSNQLPIGTFIDNFIYEYAEEKEDTGSFVITTDNPDICDLPQLQYEEILWLQWGYILPDSTVVCGKPRRVMITDISVSFKNNGVTLEIKFADSNILLKNIPANYYSKEAGWLQGVLNTLKGHLISPVIKTYRSSEAATGYYLLVNQGTDYETSASKANNGQVTVISKAEGTYDGPIISSPGKEVDRTMYQSSLQPAYELPEDATPVKVIELTTAEAFSDEITKLIEESPDKYKLIDISRSTQGDDNKLIGRLYDSIVVTSSTPNNVWGQLNNICKQLPDGPYYMDARDGQLVLHNKMVDRPVSIKYTYAGGNGELLDFGVNSKFIRSVVEISSGADIDPTSKTLSSTVVQGIGDRSMVNPDIYYVGWGDSTDNGPDSNKSRPVYRQLYSLEELKKVTGSPVSGVGLIPKTKSSDPTVVIGDTQTTQQEREQWAKESYKDWDRAVNHNISTQGELEEAIHQGFWLKPFKVTRVKAIKVLADSENSATTYAKKILGDVPIIQITKGNFVGKRWTNTVAGYSDMPDNSYRDHYDYYVAYNAEVSIDGIRVVNDVTDWTSLLQANDIQENISNQVKATGIVLGRPSIETSMNIEIAGVSKFSGIWYTKVVKHRINTSNGYTTEIEFVPRNSMVSRTIISKHQALSGLSNQLNRESQKSIESGAYENASPEYIEKIIEATRHKYPGKSATVNINPDGTHEVKSTEDSFNTSEGININTLK